MKEPRAADRYATALLDFSLEKNNLEKIKQDVDLIINTILGSRELSLLLNSPIVNADKKIKIISEIFKGKITDITLSFVSLIAKKRRENILLQVGQRFVELYNKHKGVQRVEVTSANGLDEGLRKKVYDLVKNSTNSEIELLEKTDPELIGGFVLRIGDNQLDSSIVRSIKRLKNNLTT